VTSARDTRVFTAGGYRFIWVEAAVRRRAEETVIDRALAAAVNRHVNWHEHL
jgi:hypothetical protein